MNRRNFLKAAGITLASFTIPSCADNLAGSVGNSKKPNIVFIMADDMGYGDLGCYNKKSKIPTH